MAKSITSEDLINNKRLASLELQIFTFLGNSKRTVPEIQKSFHGLASVETIENIVKTSIFFDSEDEYIVALDSENKADISYDFNSDSPSVELLLSGKSSNKGDDQTQTGVSLTVGTYEMTVKVVGEGVGNWKLNVKKIEVTTSGNEHQRVLDGNPLEGEGTYPEQIHFTNPKI